MIIKEWKTPVYPTGVIDPGDWIASTPTAPAVAQYQTHRIELVELGYEVAGIFHSLGFAVRKTTDGIVAEEKRFVSRRKARKWIDYMGWNAGSI